MSALSADPAGQEGKNGAGESVADRPALGLIAGPTASGKSALALRLAEAMPIGIINADASQIYREIPIISAAPAMADRAICPHYLFGTLSGQDSCSAARWADLAKAAIADCRADGRIPVLVGGSGLYLRTLIDGIAPVPGIDPAIRAAVRRLQADQAYAALCTEDAEMAQRLNPGDSSRIARALEVVRSTGRSIRCWQAARTGGLSDAVRIVPIILLPPREPLYARIEARFAAMIGAGACAEIETLEALAYPASAPVMQAIGVKQLSAVLRGDARIEDAMADAVQATRRYAKRQYTWFRHQPPATWPRYDDELNDENISHIVIKLHEMLLT